MWEFSLNFKSEDFDVAKYVYTALQNSMYGMGGVVTSHEQGGNISVLVAVSSENEQRAKSQLTSVITELICTKFKGDYLNKYLMLPFQDKIGIHAFKRALLNFDRETDRYMVKRALVLTHSLYLDSFFAFKLASLKDKWEELVTLANENRDYLISKESFIDLLKFLVDNLDICEDEIGVVKEADGYRIINAASPHYQNQIISEEKVVSTIIDLSPQKINLYFQESSGAIALMQRLFEERIFINQEKKTIKNFKLN